MAIRLCLDESTADLGATLAGRETDLGVGGALLDFLVGLGEDELDVAGVGHVGVDLERYKLVLIPGVTIVGWDVHDREHGKCGGDPWGPG